MNDLTPDEIALLLAALPSMPRKEQEALLADLDLLDQQNTRARAKTDFMAFCHYVYLGFKEGPHHRHINPLLHEVMEGTQLRLTVSMPPRFGKSETCAFLFVAWYLGHHPSHQIMMVTHTADLSADFGRKVRNLIDSGTYRELFPETVVSRDKSAASNWSTTLGGKYLAIGIGANVAGHGADLLIGDDIVSEQAVLASDPDKTFAQAWEYVQVGPVQRLMPNGRIILIGTRWGKKDPIGRALAWAENNPESLPWHEVRFPAIMPSGKSLWPEQWPVDQLLAKKAGMFPQFWAAQYMQEPTSEEGALIKREWWRIWEKKDPPPCTLILQSWDTAHGKHDSADPSGVQTWGIWYNPEQEQDQLILLDAWTGRKEFPELKQFALEYYKEWKPDMVIIEKKAAGAPLIQELRKIGIPVDEYTPSRGADKRARINSVADMFASGMVWAPDRRWAHAVIDEIAEFPNGEHDENVDCLVAGTLIETAQGPRPIETLRVGDSVLTHLGFRTVTSAVCTGEQAVWQLQHGKGVLVGTGNHPIHTQAGWKALDKLERTDTIDTVSTMAAASWPLKNTEPTGKRLFLTGTRIRNIQSARILNVLAGGIFCTAIFGHCTMAQFLRGTTSIIRTRTKQTTRWGTWSFFPRATIGESTTAETLSSTTHPSTWPIWKAYGQKRQHGTAPQREGSGTSSTPVPPSTARGLQRHTQELFRKSARACCVERSSWQRQHARCTAAQNASRVWPMLESALQSLRRIGAVVTASLFSTLCRQKQNIVVSNAKVLSIVPLGRQPVYNLAVQEAETYYANGVLVHNCCSQALMRFRAGGLIRLQSDQKDPPVEYRRRTAAYY